jgi:diketogulonate reductase-like aldo/keto reductase
VEKTLKETGLSYIDLMLIHAPYGGRDARKGAWKALVEAQEEGKIRSLGISNYGVIHLVRNHDP